MSAAIHRRGLGFLRARWPVVLRLAAWSVLETGQTFLLGYAPARALDDGFLRGRSGVGLGWLGVAALGVVVGAYGTARVYTAVAALVEPLRDRLVTRVVERGVREGDRGTLSGLTQQVEIARDTFAGLVMVSRSFVFTAAGALAGLLSLAPLLLLVVGPPLVAGVGLFAATLRPLARRQEAFLRADEALADRLGAVGPGLRDITAAGAERQIAADTGGLVDAELRAARSLARQGVLRVIALALGGQLPIVLLLATAPWLLAHGVTAGALVGALAYVTQSLLPALHNLVHGLGTSGSRLAVVVRRLVPERSRSDTGDGSGRRRSAPGFAVGLRRLVPDRSRGDAKAGPGARRRGGGTPAVPPPRDSGGPPPGGAPASPRLVPLKRNGEHAVPGQRGARTPPEPCDEHAVPAPSDAHTAPERYGDLTAPDRLGKHVTPDRSGKHTAPERNAAHTPAHAAHGRPPAAPPADAPALSFSSVTFAYGPGAAPVIEDLDLVLPAGAHLAVVGSSGVGKSTLAALAAGVLRPRCGAVRVCGWPVPGREAAARRVLIPQEAYVFTGALAENLGHLRPDPVPETELLAAAEAVGLTPLLEALGGPEARVEPGALSAGERQLIALTRAYLSYAPLVLLDEATCHLDPRAEERAEYAFANRPGGTLVVVAHRISSARRADRTLVMDGRETTYGTHDELVRCSPLYRDLVGGWAPVAAGLSQPALALRDPDRVDAVAGPGLAGDGRHVVAHGPVGQVQVPGDLGDGGARGGKG
ncbi:ATP-binding cassette domain-containing protein [Streptomyces sp. NPDC087903]|uniref:ATP-binding cassette domain-containing protein n=1 Tax=Streptomyces sp. NPDC087903 TaxID=3365819 RepID=UPI0038202584